MVFLHELADKNGDPSVAIIQKKDGGYLYSTSDLAALRYRVGTLKANRILYFIDARQSLHMQQVFTLARKAGFADEWLSTEHHAFGTMLGSDGKPFKTRSGGTVKLAQLLDEAVERAAKEVRTKNPDLTEEEMAEVASKVGIGAVKYADLCKTRTNDYVFKRQKLYAAMDLDADGGVTFGEYEYVDGVKRQMLLKARFNKLDLDQDGKLSSSEYCSYLGSFDRFDQNGDGNITTSEIDMSKVKAAKEKPAPVKAEDDTSCLLWFCVRSSIK